MEEPTREGYAPVPGGSVWCQSVGSVSGLPLLVLHGGPGAGHRYLLPLSALGDERPIVFFDQLGCGKSDRPHDRALWRIERFAAEIDALRDHLGLDKTHLLGHSWGGWLAVEYMTTRNPAGIVGLVLSGTSASIPEFLEGSNRLRAALPAKVRAALDRHEGVGDYWHPDFRQGMLAYYQRHRYRGAWTPEMIADVLHPDPGLDELMATLWGPPTEFSLTGNMKDWDRSALLERISCPTLMTVGRFDEVVPACAETLHRGIPDSRMVVFEHSAHALFENEAEAYLQLVRSFLQAAEEDSALPLPESGESRGATVTEEGRGSVAG